jgi:RIO kinase 1
MLYHEGKLYLIDVSQSMEQSHPGALDFLRVDCRNVNDFFRRQGCQVISLEKLFRFVVNGDMSREEARSVIETLQTETNEEGEANTVDEAVFMSSFIPRSLYQVENCEVESERIATGGRESVFKVAVEGMLIGVDTSEKELEVVDDGDKGSDASGSDVDSECSSDSEYTSEDGEERPWKEKPNRSNYSTMTSDERSVVKEERRKAKKEAKEMRAERRKTKMKKHVKKQRIKSSHVKKR